MKLSLDEGHSRVLRELLDAAYRDIKVEISDTNVSTYKHELREREVVIREILTDLGGPLLDRQ